MVGMLVSAYYKQPWQGLKQRIELLLAMKISTDEMSSRATAANLDLGNLFAGEFRQNGADRLGNRIKIAAHLMRGAMRKDHNIASFYRDRMTAFKPDPASPGCQNMK